MFHGARCKKQNTKRYPIEWRALIEMSIMGDRFFHRSLFILFFFWSCATEFLCCRLFFRFNSYFVVFEASIRSFGERTANLFSRKKKNAEQSVQNTANQLEEDAEEAATSLKNDANELEANAG